MLREHLTVDERVKKLEKNYTKLKTDIDSQEKRMGGAASEAAQKQALLHSSKL
jgi:hypothetical protein